MADCGSRGKARRQKLTNDTPVNISYGNDPDEDYEVEEILDHDEPIPGSMMFRIRWKGYDESWDSWEPLHLLDNCPDKLREYKLKRGLPLTPADSTIKLTPVKAAAVTAATSVASGAASSSKSKSSSSSKGASGKTGRRTTARKTGVKRKLVPELPPPPSPIAKRTQISVESEVTSTTRTTSSSAITAASGRKKEILEIMDDGSGRYIVSYMQPGRLQPNLMWYQDAKKQIPDAVIDYFESNLKFTRSGGQNFALVPPE